MRKAARGVETGGRRVRWDAALAEAQGFVEEAVIDDETEMRLVEEARALREAGDLFWFEREVANTCERLAGEFRRRALA